ncbi:leader peptidase (prepilin peptidase)/N-methyltransferase [Kineococcus radiotolerans]|uniref:Prepilin leader peptidase/N-methyltransferase n=1 Tax=Kineococcus radiotolerans TaxID=131568 RepID=A0A7W4TPQ7_KINRA|nr:A24 family peptidase [Kineococcus radiotolerans]MBB2902841.1 leader peptidase (prepilin peptidase)/N-methyltransferase [Kineococcus radiotolerans]
MGEYTGPLVVGAVVLGLLIGSFLNVVVHRVPLGLSVVSPPSACPGCGHRIRERDNVPVLSWLLLRGRCRGCAEPISVRYPLVEAGTGLLFGLVTAVVGLSWSLPAYLYLAAIAVALALIDLDVRRLPDQIVLPSYPVAAVLLTLASWGDGDWGALLRAAVGGAALFLVYGVLFVVKPGGMGLGDVKLAGVLGLYLGWWSWGALAVGGFSAFVFGGVAGVAVLALRGGDRKSKIPFGPYMLGGAIFALLAAEPVAQWYLRLLGIAPSA